MSPMAQLSTQHGKVFCLLRRGRPRWLGQAIGQSYERLPVSWPKGREWTLSIMGDLFFKQPGRRGVGR